MHRTRTIILTFFILWYKSERPLYKTLKSIKVKKRPFVYGLKKQPKQKVLNMHFPGRKRQPIATLLIIR